MASEPTSNISVVVAGESLYTWKPLQRCLAREPVFVVIRCADVLSDVFFCCQRVTPCVLLAERAFAEKIERSEFAARFRSSASIQLLVKMEEPDSGSVERFLRMGYAGCLPADVAPKTLALAVRTAAAGILWADRELLSKMLRQFIAADQPARLTTREAEILGLIARGYRNKEIAEKLFLSFETVRWHIRSLYAKIGVHDRVSAALYGMEQFIHLAETASPQFPVPATEPLPPGTPGAPPRRRVAFVRSSRRRQLRTGGLVTSVSPEQIA